MPELQKMEGSAEQVRHVHKTAASVQCCAIWESGPVVIVVGTWDEARSVQLAVVLRLVHRPLCLQCRLQLHCHTGDPASQLAQLLAQGVIGWQTKMRPATAFVEMHKGARRHAWLSIGRREVETRTIVASSPASSAHALAPVQGGGFWLLQKQLAHRQI